MRAPCNIALTTCFDVPIDRARFERAAKWLQVRYGMLSARVDVAGDEVRFVPNDAPIPVEWRERRTREDWRAIGARELGTGFPSAPYIRLTVIADAHGADLIVCISHMIGDGLSMAQITTDLIRCLEDPDRPSEPVPDRGTLDERAPRAVRGKWFHFARHLIEQIAGAPHDPVRNARLASGYHGRSNVDWITIELSAEETTRLRTVSRERGTTVQGALTAAMSLAVGERAARMGRKRIAVHSPINLRKIVEPPAPDEIGNFAAGTTTWVPCQGDLWEIARAVKADIEQAIARGAPFANERLAKGSKTNKPRTKPRWIALRLWPDLGVTNLGPFAAPDTPLGRSIREMHILLALPVMESLACGTVTVHGKLFCDFHFCPDDVPREEMAPLVESARRHLRSALA